MDCNNCAIKKDHQEAIYERMQVLRKLNHKEEELLQEREKNKTLRTELQKYKRDRKI